jgi:pimeloyl-ACP methyl ester carboxylesterase
MRVRKIGLPARGLRHSAPMALNLPRFRVKAVPSPRSRKSDAAAGSPGAAANGAAHEAADRLNPPHALLLMLEGRAPWEYAALVAATPWLRRLPMGDRHSVLVLPGLGANDFTTQPLRSFLQGLGYDTHPWKQGFNFGPRKGVLQNVVSQARDLVRSSGRPISLVGWSLGGIYAREVAKEMPQDVRCVVTLGTPFGGHPRATNAWRFYEMVSGQKTHDPALLQQIKEAPPVPTTSIYSKTDGIVAWQCSINDPGPQTENIEVQASHVGMGLNPLALYIVADRLAQPVGRWQPFKVHDARRWFLRPPWVMA